MGYDRYDRFQRVGDDAMAYTITLPTVNPTLTSGSLTVGRRYRITVSAGGADWTNVGAANNNVGTEFVATGTTPTAWGSGTLEWLKLGGDVAIATWFPNAPGGALTRGAQLFLGVTNDADRTLLVGADNGESLSVLMVFKQFDNGNPATGNVVRQKADTIVWTRDNSDGFPLGDAIKSPSIRVPEDFDPDTLRMELLDLANETLSELKLYAVR